jgi:hypothetical protein
VAFLLFLAAVPVLLVVLLPGAPNPFGRLLSSGIYVLLAIFVSRGSRFALGVTMVLFTFSRVTDIAANVVSPLTWAINLAWWMFFMERFWKAYRVEQARALVSGPGSQSGPDVATP